MPWASLCEGNPLRVDHHIALLGKPRTLALRSLVYDTVRPGMIVLDAGTGSGLLATWAALAGAERVVTVDREHSGLALDLARANGVDDRISHITGDIMESLPQDSFDVIFGMLYENDPRRDEWVAQFLPQLVEKCLAPGGTVVPGVVEYLARVEDRPDQDYFSARARVNREVERLGETLSLNLQPVADWAMRSPLMPMFPARGWDGVLTGGGRVLAPDRVVHSVDYSAGSAAGRDWPHRLSFALSSPGTATCVVWTQKLLASDGRLIFSNESVSWLERPGFYDAGATLSVGLGDDWWQRNVVTVEVGGEA